MNMKFKNFRKSAELFGAMCGGLLITLPAIPQALAQQSVGQQSVGQQSTPKINPCPRVFYEEPHNSRVVVPQGCPPNALTQRLAAQGLLPVPATPSQEQTRLGVGGEAPVPSVSSQSPVSAEQTQQPATGAVSTEQPLLQPRQTPSTTIALTNGTVNIRLINDTAANVTYQVIGDTAPRSLQGKSYVTLQGLRAPVTVTFERQDSGQLIVTPQPSSESGSLEVRFKEATNAAQGRSALRIERNGSVFLN
ncbi:hypothetical protein NIES4072_03620 [Nostoc commune NIES-4072]|uniref:AMIN domain-containing protein n=1 Tax=Nostoc commune NIES-4072 TaxID=2005467 RepID=A0A2R5FE90_NOSCO|nr:hypothetical protein [Nostoc commune]BBD65959.1 hypothetical protein NIES4070_23200 [Nostoc commune HK-02]GBG16716.1 hypothetical protein NIES4072_03620 [Nostoc commune NIES-4072]